MKAKWEEVAEFANGNSVFVCHQCRNHCIAVGKSDKVQDCPSAGTIVGNGTMKMATNAIHVDDE